MFTLSCVNAILNALVIAIFMPHEVIALYGLDGSAFKYGSRWFYLIPLAIPLLISGSLLIAEKFSSKQTSAESQPDKTDSDEIENEDTTNAIDVILTGNTPHSDNLGMVFTWFFAVLSWVLTGIALNSIENISVIMPSIIVIMLSAVMIFMTSIYSNASPDSVCGIKLSWLKDNIAVQKKSGRFSTYMGVLSGMLGVCLAAWSLVVGNNIPNCIAVVILVIFAFVLPIFYSYIIEKRINKK